MIARLLAGPIKNEKGVSDLIVLLIVLPIFFAITVMMVTLFTFKMRQAKLDDIKDRALQMVETAGYLTPAIEDDIRTKMASLGYDAVTKSGTNFPTFAGSTMNKVRKNDADPTVKLVIQYPASDLAKLMVFFGVASTEDPGYFYLEGYGRSEQK
ncbi:hypothetical protein I8J29_16545 [Paenibacillus sp. MWE-103]|uniref:Uncharacterized protein n=1 Tax=Paenibacillus artemisiicola TaxID=1172618 RepID=A0ABS3WBX0_9BACL|nr:hypothetical protein [Paenibacillus artemisiicola]MBO7745819.1 hypothetical protein [Paenibacillus artemisiicola]